MEKEGNGRVFRELLEAQWARDCFVCAGFDPNLKRIPEVARRDTIEETLVTFCCDIFDAVADQVCAVKPNIAFFEAHGLEGLSALIKVTAYMRKHAPQVPIILDAKRADIGNTNLGYVASIDAYGVDAITVHPYLGRLALEPFLARKDKGIIVLCRTSNKGAGEFQDLYTLPFDPVMDEPILKGASTEERLAELEAWVKEWRQRIRTHSMPLYQRVAFNVANEWNANGNCCVVVGATYPTEGKEVRKLVGDIPFLIPGIGAQGGDVEATVMACADGRKWGMTINSSRGIMHASNGPDYMEAAHREAAKLHSEINRCRTLLS